MKRIVNGEFVEVVNEKFIDGSFFGSSSYWLYELPNEEVIRVYEE